MSRAPDHLQCKHPVPTLMEDGSCGACGTINALVRLRKGMRTDFDQKNIARKVNGLPLMKLVIRVCLSCGYPFESLGHRTCGCIDGRHEQDPD